MATIQAVLARRCNSIGELQQHLLRAGWQRGVAQWGVLGQGEQWAPVAGFDATAQDDSNRLQPTALPAERGISFTSQASYQSPRRKMAKQGSHLSSANVLVKQDDGGGIFVDDPEFLTEWSVEAIALVRRVLKRAARGSIPYEENWIQDDSIHDSDDHDRLLSEAERGELSVLPVWVSELRTQKTDAGDGDEGGSAEVGGCSLVVTDLPLMVDEVSELLNKMEDIIETRTARRLEMLRPPGKFTAWLRCSGCCFLFYSH